MTSVAWLLYVVEKRGVVMAINIIFYVIMIIIAWQRNSMCNDY